MQVENRCALQPFERIFRLHAVDESAFTLHRQSSALAYPYELYRSRRCGVVHRPLQSDVTMLSYGHDRKRQTALERNVTCSGKCMAYFSQQILLLEVPNNSVKKSSTSCSSLL